VTLGQIRRDLSGLAFEGLGSGGGRFVTDDGSLTFEVQELAQSQLLMHIVVCEFRLQVPVSGKSAASIDLRHTGAIRRQGIGCRLRQGDAAEMAPLLARLQGDPLLLKGLLPLDFKRLQLERDAQGWSVRLEHFGASEVVNRFPGFRRYIRLDAQQRECLLATFERLRMLLAAA